MNSPNVKVHARDIDSMIGHLFLDGSISTFDLQKNVNISLERIEIQLTNSIIESLSIITEFKPFALSQITSKCTLDLIEERIITLKTYLLLIMDKRNIGNYLFFVGGLRSMYLCLLESFSVIIKVIRFHINKSKPNLSKNRSLVNIIEDKTGWNWSKDNSNNNSNNNEKMEEETGRNLSKSGSKFSLFSDKSSYSALNKQIGYENKLTISNAKLFTNQLKSTQVILDHIHERLQILLEFWEIENNNNENSNYNTYKFIPFKSISELYKNHLDLDATKVSGKFHFGFTYTKSLVEYSKKLKAMYCAVKDAQTWKDSTILSSTWFYSAAAHYFLAPEIASSYYEEVRSSLDLSVQRNVWNLMEDPVIEFFATALGLNPKKIILPVDCIILIESSIIPLTIEEIEKIHFKNSNETQFFSKYEEKKVLITCHYLFSREITLDSNLYSNISQENDFIPNFNFSLNSIRELLSFKVKREDDDPTISKQRNISIKAVSKQLSELSGTTRGYSVLSEDKIKKSESSMYSNKPTTFERKRDKFLDSKIEYSVDKHEQTKYKKQQCINDDTLTEENLPKPIIGKLIDIDDDDMGIIIEDKQCSETISYSKNDDIHTSNSPNISMLKEYDPVIILHIHGGGWISQSPKTHLAYLRTWAKLTNLPILSVDYGLSPENEFPSALNECYAAYIWLLNPDNAQKLGLPCFTSPPRIILAGDSAGGNLCCSLTIRLIQEYLPIPIGILLSYPVVNLTPCGSISRMVFAHDPVLNYQSMQIVLNSYLGARTDLAFVEPLISPGIVSDDILSQFPETYIMCGDTDPIIDDSTFFFQRLRDVGVSTKLKIYSKLPHGYLNLPSQLPNATQAISDAAKFLKTMMHNDDKKKGFTIV